MGNPVVHFEIMGGDGERLKGFYSDLFGWKIDSNNPIGGMLAAAQPDSVETQPVTFSKRVRVVSVAPLLAEAVRRIHQRASLSELFSAR